jgi:MoxR-like ATPase
MLEIRLMEARGEVGHASAHDIFGPEFLIKRPLLQALESPGGTAPVLLIDEIDRADEEFEAYLLEILSDFQVTVPEIGTIKAEQKPRVILTSNRTREVHDALKRRCLYHWIDFPSAEKELEIVLTRVPGAPATLARQVVGFVHRLRRADLTKVPGIAETLDWAAALMALGAAELTQDLLDDTLGVVLKYEEDIRHVRGTTAQAYLAETAAGAGS